MCFVCTLPNSFVDWLVLILTPFSLKGKNKLSPVLFSDFRRFSFFKERKAARLSKEAIKQLHSETQRLIRGKTCMERGINY